MFPSLPEEDLLPPTLPIASPIAELSVAPSTDGTPANSPSPPMSPEQVRSISVLHQAQFKAKALRATLPKPVDL
jgi:hypothetical protein